MSIVPFISDRRWRDLVTVCAVLDQGANASAFLGNGARHEVPGSRRATIKRNPQIGPDAGNAAVTRIQGDNETGRAAVDAAPDPGQPLQHRSRQGER